MSAFDDYYKDHNLAVGAFFGFCAAFLEKFCVFLLILLPFVSENVLNKQKIIHTHAQRKKINKDAHIEKFSIVRLCRWGRRTWWWCELEWTVPPGGLGLMRRTPSAKKKKEEKASWPLQSRERKSRGSNDRFGWMAGWRPRRGHRWASGRAQAAWPAVDWTGLCLNVGAWHRCLLKT